MHPLSIARGRRLISLGFASLWLHRLRSLLTVLGIVFGVCSVIAMLAIGEGASYVAQKELAKAVTEYQKLVRLAPKTAEDRKVVELVIG